MALAAQGFGRAHPPTAGRARIETVLHRLRLLQIDSVNVFERSHHLPVFARLGPYDRGLLDRMLFDPAGDRVEYWAHEAASVPKADLELFAFRMDRFRAKHGDAIAAHADLAGALLAEIADRGPIAASEVEEHPSVRQGPWWGWSDTKRVLELLFRTGDLVSAGRRGFERRYGLPEQVLGGPVQRVPAPVAVRELVRRAAVAHGVAALPDLADYHRLRSDETLVAARELEDAGELVPVEVPGWTRADGRPLLAWRHVDAAPPARLRAAALLSPFDPVVWQRDRILRLFGFHYRISIYTPAAQREHGYYVLPALVDDRLVGRVDLKSDRQAGRLLVQAAWAEPSAPSPPSETAARLAPVLRDAAAWQGLDAIEVVGAGDLAPALADVLAAR
ncbi:winged helix-turn-helix domain-containing protein [Amnibacterium setariae]|uniref:Winged helix-turn-helix domain-containing protein n=1 Tax=Amnibacterium setariae TaxID=2306585 RepID=A0A3A1U4X5_9MICO|nr:winged helix-turn-helix domain-containing protein [Amnibacterium setariae]